MLSTIKLMIICSTVLLSYLLFLRSYIIFILLAELLWLTCYAMVLLCGTWGGVSTLFGTSFFILLIAAIEIVVFFMIYVLYKELKKKDV